MEPVAFQSQLSEARSQALAGEYRSSIVYYDGVLDQLNKFLKTLNDPYSSGKWQEARKKLISESELVKDLQREVQLIGNGAAAQPQRQAEVSMVLHDCMVVAWLRLPSCSTTNMAASSRKGMQLSSIRGSSEATVIGNLFSL